MKLVAPPGFEPGNGGTKTRCLTAWLRGSGIPSRIRTGISAVKEQRPKPLDDGDKIAERARFERAVPLARNAPLAPGCLQPLGHLSMIWCRLPGSNWRPPAYEAGALPAELRRHAMVRPAGLELAQIGSA